MKHWNAWILIGLLTSMFSNCSKVPQEANEHPAPTETAVQVEHSPPAILDTTGTTILERFNPPAGFTRISVDSNSFAAYLRNLPLKPDGTPVKLYDGSLKGNQRPSAAVVDLPIGNKDLHQCADAIMRLRAEYLYAQAAFDKIHFNFTNGFRVDYSEWMKGKRIAVNGNKTNWVSRTSPSNTYQDFWQYLEMIFMYAGTLSLEQELQPVALTNLTIGDVFIQGGSPGHAVIVIDVALDESGHKLFLLAQSYMPAQEIHVLNNPNDGSISPWYRAEISGSLYTPEWTFETEDLRRFEQE